MEEAKNKRKDQKKKGLRGKNKRKSVLCDLKFNYAIYYYIFKI